MFALLEAAKKEKVPEVYIHFVSDGRDSAPKSAERYAIDILEKIEELKIGKIATLCGRYYSMDRDRKWDRTKKAFDLMTKGKGTPAKNIFEAIEKAYKKVDNDQFIPPFILDKEGTIKKKDSVIIFNFRADREQQITKKLSKHVKKLTTMTRFFDGKNKTPILVEKSPVENSFGEYISNLGIKQYRIAETEKAAHITYFFNGGKKQFKGEVRKIIPSPKVSTYDKSPNMSTKKITDALTKTIKSGKYEFILVNYSNADMLGHTGNIPKAIKGIEFTDKCLGKVIESCEKNDYLFIVTADHGNAEEMYDEHGEISTAHSFNQVTFTIKTTRQIDLKNGGLKNVSPTILDYWNIEKPKEMTSKSLIV
jgi:2,3-bisphosphoglycerate-independent phosphoglycerate mutase